MAKLGVGFNTGTNSGNGAVSGNGLITKCPEALDGDVPAMDVMMGQHYYEEAQTLFDRHHAAFEQGNHLEDASVAVARALEYIPDSPEAMLLLAKTSLALGHYLQAERQAIAAQSVASQVSPGKASKKFHAELGAILGETYQSQGHWEKAAQAYENAIRHAPLHKTDVWLGLGFSRLRGANTPGQSAWASVHNALVSGSALLAGSLLSVTNIAGLTGAPAIRLSLSQFWAGLQKEVGFNDAALKSFLALAAGYPGVAEFGIMVADLFRERGDKIMAGLWYQKVWNRHPSNVLAIAGLGRLAEIEGNYDELARLYQALVRLRPGDCHAWCHLANASYYSRRYDEALKAYETALQLGTDAQWRAMIAQGMGNIHADYLNNPVAAQAYYEMARTLDPADVENHTQLGSLYFRQGNYTNAEIIYRQALRLAPDNARLHANLGYLHWIDGNVEAAKASYLKAIALDSSYEVPVNNLGVIYLDTDGDLNEAVALFHKALKIQPDYALAYYNLGRTHTLQGDRTAAARCFRRAQELNDVSRDLDNAELTARIQDLFEAM